MKWSELLEFLLDNQDKEWYNDTCQIYDSDAGEYYPADVIEFVEGDEFIDSGTVFLTFGDCENE